MDDLIQQGITANKAGKKDEARKYFIAAIKENRDNEYAWQYMYNVANGDKERLSCLQQILRINPQNEKAKVLLNQLKHVEPTNNVQPQVTLRKKCPYCAEDILLDAKICRFCGRDLQIKPISKKSRNKSLLIGIVTTVALIVIVSVIYIFFGNQVAILASPCNDTVLKRFKGSTVRNPQAEGILNVSEETENFWSISLMFKGLAEAKDTHWVIGSQGSDGCVVTLVGTVNNITDSEYSYFIDLNTQQISANNVATSEIVIKLFHNAGSIPLAP